MQRLLEWVRVLAVVGLAGLAGAAAVASRARADDLVVSGRLVESQSQRPVGQAQIRLVSAADSTQAYIAYSADDGTFRFAGVGAGAYRLEALRLGFMPLRVPVPAGDGTRELGRLAMIASAVPLKPFVVQSSPPPAIQRADTTEFNAKAFKTHPDADVGDLLEKMPGIQIQNGTVKSNGETVQQVLVDGKPFFGQDPQIALRSLPAEVIDKIQVFDKLSDQAEFTGFDDGQSIKTINLVLRPERRESQFGKAYGGPGTDEKYLGGGSGHVLRGDTRLSVIGLADNVNQQNFSSQDLLGVLNTSGGRGGAFGGGANGRRAGGGRGGGGGGGGFGGGGAGGFGPGNGPGGLGTGGFGGGPGSNPANFLVGPQNGVTTTTSVGTNYSTTWGRKINVTQSYFFNAADDRDIQDLARDYAEPLDSITHYGQSTSTHNRNFNHRYDARFEDNVTSTTSLIDVPRLYFQDNHAGSNASGVNTDPTGDALSQSTSTSNAATTGENLSDNFTARHRFAQRGRTISMNVALGYSDKNGTSALGSNDEYAPGSATPSDTLLRHTQLATSTSTVTARLVYTEPVGGFGLLQANLAPRYSTSQSSNHAFLPDPVTGGYVIADTTQSNSFTSTSSAGSGGIGFLVRNPKFNLASNLSWQASQLHDVQSVPFTNTIDRSFGDLLPSLTMNYNITSERNLRFSFFTNTRTPSISQLQNVVDVSNPLALTTGNPDLRESISRSLIARFSTTNAAAGQSIFLLLSAQRTDGYIATTTLTAARDSMLQGGTILHAGSQLSYPVNLDDAWQFNSFLTYSHPLTNRKLVLNLNTGATYSRTPGLIGTAENFADTWAYNEGGVLSSNISEKVDFTLSYAGSINRATNSLPDATGSNYYNHTAGLKLNLIFWRGIVVRNEVSQVLYSGLGPGYDENIVLWNVALAQKLFHDQSGEIRLTASDVLDQNRSVSRTVTSDYVQDQTSLTLKPYVMLQFTWTLK